MCWRIQGPPTSRETWSASAGDAKSSRYTRWFRYDATKMVSVSGHFALLRNLGHDGSRPSDLAARAGVTRQAITKIVDELERLDLVRREPDPDDGRGVIVRYTDRGRAGLELARKRMLTLERGYAKRVGVDHWAQVRTTLETLFDDANGT